MNKANATKEDTKSISAGQTEGNQSGRTEQWKPMPIDIPIDHDPVNHPPHYTAGRIECIDAIEAMVGGMDGESGFLAGQVLKYLWRHQSKDNAHQDLCKARWYLDRLIGKFEGETK